MTTKHLAYFRIFRCTTCGDYVRCKINKKGEPHEDGHITKEEATALTLAGVRHVPFSDCWACAAGGWLPRAGRA